MFESTNVVLPDFERESIRILFIIAHPHTITGAFATSLHANNEDENEEIKAVVDAIS